MTCTIEIDGFGGPEFCRERMVKARKTHKCYECHRLIAPGEVYEYTIGKWEGEFRVFKTCPDCLSLRDEFFCSWNYGCIWEDFDEELSNGAWETYGDRLAGLTEFARAKAAELIEGYWEQDKYRGL